MSYVILFRKKKEKKIAQIIPHSVKFITCWNNDSQRFFVSYYFHWVIWHGVFSCLLVMLINVNIIIVRCVIPFTTCAFIFFHFHEDLVRNEWMNLCEKWKWIFLNARVNREFEMKTASNGSKPFYLQQDKMDSFFLPTVILTIRTIEWWIFDRNFDPILWHDLFSITFLLLFTNSTSN